MNRTWHHPDSGQESRSRDSAGVQRRRLLATAAAGGSALARFVLAGTASPAVAQDAARLEGPWTAEFQIKDPPPGRQPARFPIVFVPDGSVLAQVLPGGRNQDGSFNFLNMGFGAWVRIGPRMFQFNYSYQRHLENFARVELATTSARISMDNAGEELTGTWKRRDTDAAGNVTFTIEGTVRATPLRVTPL